MLALAPWAPGDSELALACGVAAARRARLLAAHAGVVYRAVPVFIGLIVLVLLVTIVSIVRSITSVTCIHIQVKVFITMLTHIPVLLYGIYVHVVPASLRTEARRVAVRENEH